MVRGYWAILWAAVRARIDLLRKEPEAGVATEYVLIVALIAVAVVAIIGIIVAKLVAKANSIDLGLGA